MQGKLKKYLAIVLLFIFADEILGQQVSTLQRQDQKMVPVLVYPPHEGTCRGIALVSPGAGGSENGYAYLGRGMSALGYFTVVIGHQESGKQALRKHILANGVRDGLSELITEPEAYKGRWMDIAATKNWAQNQCRGKESILLGHSMGAATVMMEAGAQNHLGLQGANAFDMYIALSPQGVGTIFPRNAWSTIQRPVLTITGTKDKELGGASWETRTEPFANMQPGCKWLGVIDDASHMNFAGRGLARTTESLTTDLIKAFVEAVHRGDCKSTEPKTGLQIQSK